LFTQFWTALGETLTRRITQLPRYLSIHATAFDLTTMTTKDRQMSALRELRSLAVESWNSAQDDKQSMRDMMRELTNGHKNTSRSHVVEANAHVSSAEATMQRYSNLPPSPIVDRQPSPSTAIQTNHQIPSSPAPDELKSDFAPDFRGCLGCGGADHVFRSCAMKSDPRTLDRFHKNYNIKFNRPQRPAQQRQPSAYSPSRQPADF
jgi:hypothetical protein